MTDTIEIDRLQKRYGSRIALHELDLHVRPGTVFGLIGPCLLYTSPSPRDQRGSRMPSSA